jgi:ATP-dependent DNA ligase
MPDSSNRWNACRLTRFRKDNWTYELKLDGYRLEAVKTRYWLELYSRRGNDLTKKN